MRRGLIATLGALAIGCVLLALYAVNGLRGGMTRAPAEMFAYQRQNESSGSLPELWQVPSFSFHDQHGKATTERDLSGTVWIADFIYTSCTNVCPVISAKRSLLERKLAGVPLRFASFSVDPEHDTPKALSEYAATWGGDDRWILFSTDREGLTSFAAGMRVAVEPTSDPQNPILHSNMFLLVDARGSVRGVYDSADREALERLISDAKKLIGEDAKGPAAIESASGEALFMSLGCGACHSNDRIAPALGGLLGKDRTFVGGGRANADLAYLKESIIAPGSKVVLGYLNLMPAYAQDLSDAQIDSLVDYIQKLPAKDAENMAAGANAVGGNPQTAAEPATLTVDPVCKMDVRVAPNTPRFDVDGHAYYFCSELCRDRFAKNPNQYLAAKH